MNNHNIELLAGIVGNQAHSAKESKGTIKYLERVRDEFIKSKGEMKREIDRLREVVGNRNNREAELEKEIDEIKLKRAKGMLSADIVMKDLFGDGYVYAGMDALRKNIKEKMDRHEKTKEENAALKRENEKKSIVIKNYAELRSKLIEMSNKIYNTTVASDLAASSAFGPPTHEQLINGIDTATNEFYALKEENKTLDLDALRLHLGKSKRGHELLKQFDNREK